MAGESYYFLISLVLVEGIVLYMANLLLLRSKGKTTFGIAFKPATEEYKRVIKLANNRNMIIGATLTLTLIANLIYSINRLLDSNGYQNGLVLFLTAFVFVISLLIFFIVRKQVKGFVNDR